MVLNIYLFGNQNRSFKKKLQVQSKRERNFIVFVLHELDTNFSSRETLIE